MGGNDRCLGNLHQIPEALVAEVTYIDQHAKTLCFPHIFPAQFGQALASLMRACQNIAFVPSKRGNTEADLIEHFQHTGIKIETCRTFNGQDGGHFSVFTVFFNVLRCKGLCDQITVALQLEHKPLQFSFKHRHWGHIVPFFHEGRCKAGEALGVATQSCGSLQVNVQFVLSQGQFFIHVLAQKRQGSITMQVKNRNSHSKASSK